MEQSIILDIESPLSGKHFFVQVNDENTTVADAVSAAIYALRNEGKMDEANSLEQLFKSHSLFQNGAPINKSALVKDLTKRYVEKDGRQYPIAQLQAATQHSGGA